MDLEEDSDEALEAGSAGSGRAKAGLIRECVAARQRGVREDPLDALVGKFDIDPAEVDEVVCSRCDSSIES